MTVVLVRSYSRITGRTSIDSDTDTSRKSRASSAPIAARAPGWRTNAAGTRRSASTPSATRCARSPAATAASSSGTSDLGRRRSDALVDLQPQAALDERRAASSQVRSYSSRRSRSRRSSSTSRKPAVVSSPVRAPARSRIALVATVVPWMTSRTARRVQLVAAEDRRACLRRRRARSRRASRAPCGVDRAVGGQ